MVLKVSVNFIDTVSLVPSITTILYNLLLGYNYL